MMFLEKSVSPQAAVQAAQANLNQLPATGSDEWQPAAPPRIQVTQVNGIWRTTIDGRFYGDFSRETDAAAAVAACRSSIA